MSKANVDPAELKRFAGELNRFNQDLSQLMSTLHTRLRNLEQTWRDQEQRKFTEAFDQTARGLSHFLEASQQHAAFLQKKAAIIEQYLKQQ